MSELLLGTTEMYELQFLIVSIISVIARISALFVLVFSIVLVWKQLGKASAQFRSNLLMRRQDLYSSTTEINDEYIKTSTLHWRDHWDKGVYEKHYENNKDARRSYLIMKRKYMYLLFQEDFDVTFQGAAIVWMGELIAWVEMQHIREFHKRYYPEFEKRLKKIFEEKKLSKPTLWFFNGQPIDQKDEK